MAQGPAYRPANRTGSVQRGPGPLAKTAGILLLVTLGFPPVAVVAVGFGIASLLRESPHWFAITAVILGFLEAVGMLAIIGIVWLAYATR